VRFLPGSIVDSVVRTRDLVEIAHINVVEVKYCEYIDVEIHIIRRFIDLISITATAILGLVLNW
jgi:hypothetical protein